MYIFRVFLALMIALSLSYCSGGSGDHPDEGDQSIEEGHFDHDANAPAIIDEPIPTGPIALEGLLLQEMTEPAEIEAREINEDGSLGKTIAKGKTDSQGKYKLSIPRNFRDKVRVQATSGSYKNAKTNKQIFISKEQPLFVRNVHEKSTSTGKRFKSSWQRDISSLSNNFDAAASQCRKEEAREVKISVCAQVFKKSEQDSYSEAFMNPEIIVKIENAPESLLNMKFSIEGRFKYATDNDYQGQLGDFNYFEDHEFKTVSFTEDAEQYSSKISSETTEIMTSNEDHEEDEYTEEDNEEDEEHDSEESDNDETILIVRKFNYHQERVKFLKKCSNTVGGENICFNDADGPPDDCGSVIGGQYDCMDSTIFRSPGPLPIFEQIELNIEGEGMHESKVLINNLTPTAIRKDSPQRNCLNEDQNFIAVGTLTIKIDGDDDHFDHDENEHAGSSEMESLTGITYGDTSSTHSKVTATGFSQQEVKAMSDFLNRQPTRPKSPTTQAWTPDESEALFNWVKDQSRQTAAQGFRDPASVKQLTPETLASELDALDNAFEARERMARRCQGMGICHDSPDEVARVKAEYDANQARLWQQRRQSLEEMAKNIRDWSLRVGENTAWLFTPDGHRATQEWVKRLSTGLARGALKDMQFYAMLPIEAQISMNNLAADMIIGGDELITYAMNEGRIDAKQIAMALMLNDPKYMSEELKNRINKSKKDLAQSYEELQQTIQDLPESVKESVLDSLGNLADIARDDPELLGELAYSFGPLLNPVRLARNAKKIACPPGASLSASKKSLMQLLERKGFDEKMIERMMDLTKKYDTVSDAQEYWARMGLDGPMPDAEATLLAQQQQELSDLRARSAALPGVDSNTPIGQALEQFHAAQNDYNAPSRLLEAFAGETSPIERLRQAEMASAKRLREHFDKN